MKPKQNKNLLALEDFVKFKFMLYTKKGDDGTTKLFNSKPGERINKSSNIFMALGDTDELNSSIGFAKALAVLDKTSLDGLSSYEEVLETIQQNLFSLQAELAGETFYLKDEHISFLEDKISEIEEKLPPINSFVIPGGSLLGAYLDVTRAIARRNERSIVKLIENKEKEINPILLKYINRLSSLLYALARYENYKKGFLYKNPDYK